MTTKAKPTHDSKQKRFKGSLAGTLVQTLLIFAFIPLALMAGAAYFRARTLLEEQAVHQSQTLLAVQLNIVEREIANKEQKLEELVNSGDFRILTELALHANPKSGEFREIRAGLLLEFASLDAQAEPPSFDQFLLVDPKGNIKISSNAAWQGLALEPSLLAQFAKGHPSAALYGAPPLYRNEFVLFTAQEYKTTRGSTLGVAIGVTEKKRFQKLLEPLNGLSPLALTYFALPNQQFIHGDAETGEFKPAELEAKDSIQAVLSELRKNENPAPRALSLNIENEEAALAQIQWFPKMQVGVILAVKAADVYGRISSLIPFTVLLVAGALLATIVVAIVTVNRVVKPLRLLSEITRDFADGNWSRRADIFSNNEVGVLAASFNQMAEDLEKSYRSLERKVDQSERQIRTTAEVAQITTASDLNDTLDKTVELLVRQFGYYQASVFLVERSGKYVEFKTGYGAAAHDLQRKKYRLEVNSSSMIGWVSANNQPRIASNVTEDPLHLKSELLPETRSEACIPISLGSLALGVLDVQSAEENAFNPEAVNMLQTVASQIAAAIQNFELTEASQVNFEELARLYRASRQIAESDSEEEILENASRILKESPYPVVLLGVKGKRLETLSFTDPAESVSNADLPIFSEAETEEVAAHLAGGGVFPTLDSGDLPACLKNLMRRMKADSAACLPVNKNGALSAVLAVGSREQQFSSVTAQPYTNLADLMSVAMEKAEAIRQMKKHLRDAEALASMSEAISTSADQQTFFRALHAKIQEMIGNYNLIVALYEEKTNTISVPFSYEDGKILQIDPFPLGEGLTSILIRTRQPLMLVEDTERKAAALGAKVVGKAARSWMGAPMLVQNRPIGALIIQDSEREHAFNEDDLRFFSAITNQVAGVIYNAHLLEESQRRAMQVETAAEIARDISSSLNLDDLLIKAVNFIQKRFNFYHAAVFLHDLQGEYTVIREATGETGAQMKRAGYKIGIGSKSIVGFVSGKGEPLVVDDTAKDATYYANPLFPNTRSEAAFPLKVGERILGEIDVQSVQPYAFTEDKLRSLQILADQVAIAVVNSELFSETQEHLSQHRLLHHITSSAASGSTLEEALDSAVQGLKVTLGGDRVSILLVNREKNVLQVKAHTGYAGDLDLEVPIGSGITGWVAANKRPLRVKDVHEDPRYIQYSSNTRSELAVPLVYRNEVLGVLNAESEAPDAYSENDEEMLGTLGGSLASIIANARLLEQLRAQAERDRLIYDATTRIRRSTDIQSIMAATAGELARLTGAQYARIQIQPAGSAKQENTQ